MFFVRPPYTHEGEDPLHVVLQVLVSGGGLDQCEDRWEVKGSPPSSKVLPICPGLDPFDVDRRVPLGPQMVFELLDVAITASDTNTERVPFIGLSEYPEYRRSL